MTYQRRCLRRPDALQWIDVLQAGRSSVSVLLVVGACIATSLSTRVQAQGGDRCAGREQQFARAAEVSVLLCLTSCDEIRGEAARDAAIDEFCFEASSVFCGGFSCGQAGLQCEVDHGRASLNRNGKRDAHVSVIKCKDTKRPCQRQGNPTVHEVTLRVQGNGTITCVCGCVQTPP